MASINSFADVLRDWEGLLAGLREQPDLQGTLETEQLALEKDLSDARALKARQDNHSAGRQELTQQLKAVVAHGKEVAMAIRAVTKGKIGVRNERLVLFGVAPIRKRSRKPVVVVKLPDGVPAAPAAGGQNSGS